jgi:hypothetical protein
MMDNYETHYVSDCKSCPFHNDEHLVCLHPNRTETKLSELAYNISAPTWCPLRKAALVIDLRENGG